MMMRDVIVLVEHRANEVDSITYQMLACGRKLAEGLGGQLLALALGHELETVTETLRDQGIDKILTVDETALSHAGPEAHAHVIAEVARQTEPRVLLVGYSLVGMELAPAVATKLGIPAMTNCIDVAMREEALLITRPLFGDTRHVQVLLDKTSAAVVALQKGTFPRLPPPVKTTQVERLRVDLQTISFRSRLLEVIEEPAGGIDISKAEIVVSVGRGIGDKDKLPMIQALADALGAVMGCSRPIVDVGWLSRDRQVGSSGKNVAPKVYIACGISGASQHLSGMSESRCIIAINKDAGAPIFQLAHYGVVGDLLEVVPALTEAAKKI